MSRRIRSRLSLSLVELVIALGVFLLLMAIAVPLFLASKEGASDTQARSTLSSVLRDAKLIHSDRGEFPNEATMITLLDRAEPGLDFTGDPLTLDTPVTTVHVEREGLADADLVDLCAASPAQVILCLRIDEASGLEVEGAGGASHVIQASSRGLAYSWGTSLAAARCFLSAPERQPGLDCSAGVYAAEGGEGWNATKRGVTASARDDLSVFVGQAGAIAAGPGAPALVDGAASVARIQSIAALDVDSAGNLWFAEAARPVIRRVATGGMVSTPLGDNAGYAAGDTNGAGNAVRFRTIRDLSLFGTTIWVLSDTAAEHGRAIRQVDTATSAVTNPFNITIQDSVGIGRDQNSNTYLTGRTSGNLVKRNNPGTQSNIATGFTTPGRPVALATGTVYIPERTTHVVKAVSPAGVVSTLAGSPGAAGVADGSGAIARFTNPVALDLAPDGTIVVAEQGNGAGVSCGIRRVQPGGLVVTVARCDEMAPGEWQDASDVAVAPNGDIYVADNVAKRIIRIDVP